MRVARCPRRLRFVMGVGGVEMDLNGSLLDVARKEEIDTTSFQDLINSAAANVA